MDFRGISRLFADPDWDGPIEMDENFDPSRPTSERGERGNGGEQGDGEQGEDEKLPTPYIDRDGCRVSIIHKTVSVYDTDGKLLRQESITDYTRHNVVGEYASLGNFIRHWSSEAKKEAIRDLLRSRGIDLDAMKVEQGMSDVDDFDFICHVAFDAKPLTRKERANNVRKKDFLNKYSDAAREVLEGLLDRYMDTGIYEIEKTEILKLDPFKQIGKPSRIASLFGGRDGYLKAVKELEEEIYSAG